MPNEHPFISGRMIHSGDEMVLFRWIWELWYFLYLNATCWSNAEKATNRQSSKNLFENDLPNQLNRNEKPSPHDKYFYVSPTLRKKHPISKAIFRWGTNTSQCRWVFSLQVFALLIHKMVLMHELNSGEIGERPPLYILSIFHAHKKTTSSHKTIVHAQMVWGARNINPSTSTWNQRKNGKHIFTFTINLIFHLGNFGSATHTHTHT